MERLKSCSRAANSRSLAHELQTITRKLVECNVFTHAADQEMVRMLSVPTQRGFRTLGGPQAEGTWVPATKHPLRPFPASILSP